MAGSISWLGEFRDSATESRFRSDSLDYTRYINMVIAATVFAASLALAINDYLIGNATTPLIAARAMQIVASAIVGVASFRTRNVLVVDAATFLIVAVVLIASIIIDLGRPLGYSLHLGIDVVVLMGVYIIVPNARGQWVIALVYSSVLLWMHLLVKQHAYVMSTATILISILAANFVGFGASALHNRTRRQLFDQVEQERTMRLALEDAQQEVLELASLVPMCASCKKIRNDSGFWEQVEIYMRNKGTTVSHGLCPDCADKLIAEDQAPL